MSDKTYSSTIVIKTIMPFAINIYRVIAIFESEPTHHINWLAPQK